MWLKPYLNETYREGQEGKRYQYSSILSSTQGVDGGRYVGIRRLRKQLSPQPMYTSVCPSHCREFRPNSL